MTEPEVIVADAIFAFPSTKNAMSNAKGRTVFMMIDDFIFIFIVFFKLLIKQNDLYTRIIYSAW